jgi:hypothetical protein
MYHTYKGEYSECVCDTQECGILVGHWHRRRTNPTHSLPGTSHVSLSGHGEAHHHQPHFVIEGNHWREKSLESDMRTPSGAAQAS